MAFIKLGTPAPNSPLCRLGAEESRLLTASRGTVAVFALACAAVSPISSVTRTAVDAALEVRCVTQYVGGGRKQNLP